MLLNNVPVPASTRPTRLLLPGSVTSSPAHGWCLQHVQALHHAADVLPRGPLMLLLMQPLQVLLPPLELVCVATEMQMHALASPDLHCLVYESVPWGHGDGAGCATAQLHCTPGSPICVSHQRVACPADLLSGTSQQMRT